MALLITSDELAVLLDFPEGADLTVLDQVCESADFVVRRYLDPKKGPHDKHAHDKEAAGAVAVQIWTTRTAPGGQMQSIDFQPVFTPNLLGPGLMARVMGLVNPCRVAGGLVVG